jgi:NH3-dependent NAD+ synthetase
MVKWDLPILQEFLDAQPTAELIPSIGGVEQSDEEEMQLTYAELSGEFLYSGIGLLEHADLFSVRTFAQSREAGSMVDVSSSSKSVERP